MTRTTTAVGLILGLAGTLAAGELEGAPDWVMKGSGFWKHKLIGVGVGMSSVDALASAIGELASLRTTLDVALAKRAMAAKTSGSMKAEESSEEKKVSDRLASSDDKTFGPVIVTKRTESRTLPSRAGGADKAAGGGQEVSSDIRVTMKSGEKRLFISVKLKSVTEGDMSKSAETADLEVHGKDLSVADLIKELKSQGIEMRRYLEPDGRYEWVSLTAKAPPGCEELLEDMEEAQ